MLHRLRFVLLLSSLTGGKKEFWVMGSEDILIQTLLETNSSEKRVFGSNSFEYRLNLYYAVRFRL